MINIIVFKPVKSGLIKITPVTKVAGIIPNVATEAKTARSDP